MLVPNFELKKKLCVFFLVIFLHLSGIEQNSPIVAQYAALPDKFGGKDPLSTHPIWGNFNSWPIIVLNSTQNLRGNNGVYVFVEKWPA